MAAPAHAVTISRAAEPLDEHEKLLWEIASDMEPEDGYLWIYDTDDQQTVAFTPAGMEWLQETRDASRSTNAAGDPAVLSGWLRRGLRRVDRDAE